MTYKISHNLSLLQKKLITIEFSFTLKPILKFMFNFDSVFRNKRKYSPRPELWILQIRKQI
jgi:hypothetical protein